MNAGQSTFRASFEKGTHAIVAQYSGDATYGSASGTYSLSVTVDAMSLSVASSQPVSWFGQPVTFTARLGSPAAGTVQFSEGATLIGSALLTAGVATLTVADLPAGTHAITASWAGDASAQFVQTVSRANTATACSFGGGAIRAVVSAVAPGAGNPTGAVSFVDTVTKVVVASAALDSGFASAAMASVANPIAAVYAGDSNFFGSTSAPASPLAVVNAASYSGITVAPEEIVTLFGQNLASETQSATQPVASLGGLSVTVSDGAGVSRPAGLLFVSQAQASVLMPANLALGPATIRAGNSSVAVVVTPTAPGLFTIDGATPAGQIIRVHADGSQDAPEAVTSAPIDAADTIYLVLYGTGIRHFAATPTCTIGGQRVPVLFAGAQGGFPGLDQVNVQLPAGLSGAVKLSVTVDGVESNAVTVRFR